MQIKRVLKGLYSNIISSNTSFVSANLCGVPLQVYKGTVREQEDQDDAWWFYLAKHHSTIIDIGCNIGYTALLTLIQNPNKQILLVDPNPKALQKAAANLIQNGLGNKAHFMAAFVSDTLDDTIKFYTVGSGAAGSMHASHAETAASMNSFMEVRTVTLDYISEYYGIKPDLVKIDVEGAETYVMQAAKKTADTSKCSFFIEMHNVENLGMEAAGQQMIDWCNEMSYRAWYLKTGELLQNAEEIKNRGKCHLLLLPQEKGYPNYLKGIKQNAPLPKSV
ncbi:FkbM family methyltransferase [uncultured Winogradskyella sp.]|uniref:FkbM family methyltransferase n=1 Tax=uncultured Winogradskyella sp. TaxID=395353 RepID=UPI00262C7083|nr:FkbM family methyltransferase [uncultured Winogradskyella sp.]